PRDFYNISRNPWIDLGACQYDPAGIAGKRIFQWGVHGGLYAATQDANLDANGAAADYNYGARGFMAVSPNAPNYSKSILRFPSFTGASSNLQVPTNAHVDSAFLYLNNIQAATGDIEIYRVLRDWVEGTGTGSTSQANSVSYNSAKHGSVAWNTAGLAGLSDAMPVVDTVLTNPVAGWNRMSITALVQDWVSGVTNNGVLLADRAAPSLNLLPEFFTKDTSLKLNRPKLEVYFDTDTVTVVKQSGTSPLSETGDNYLNEASQANNYGASTDLYLNSTASTRKHPLLTWYDLIGTNPNQVPSNAAVQKSELVLYRSNTTAGLDANESKVFDVRQYWQAGSNSDASGMANWTTGQTGVTWNVAGAASAPSVNSNSMGTGNDASVVQGAPITWRCDTAAKHNVMGDAWGFAVLPVSGAIGSDIGFYSVNGTSTVSAFYNPKLKVTYAGTPGGTGTAPWKKPALPLLKLYSRVTGPQTTVAFREGDANGFGTTDDVWLSKNAPTTNQNGDGYLRTADTAYAYAMRTLIKFTNFIGSGNGQVPTGSLIDTAYIRLVEYQAGIPTTTLFNVYVVNESWTEATTTWNTRDGSTAWGNGGARGPTSSSLMYPRITLPGPLGWWDTVSVPVTAMVQRWVNGSANNGVMMEALNLISTDNSVLTSEDGTADRRPQLVVKYRKKEQVETQNIGKGATENSYFSRLDTLKNQFFLSFNLRTDSTDGMMNQWRTAATGAGQQVKLAQELLPPSPVHANLFNVIRRTTTSDSGAYSDSVRYVAATSEAVSYTVAESTTTRLVYRINPRTVYDQTATRRDATVATEFTVYPTGQVFVWDSAYTTGSGATAHTYAAQFAARVGSAGYTATSATNYWGGACSTFCANNLDTIHDFVGTVLTYKKTGVAVSTPFSSVTAYTGANSNGFYLSAANDDPWNGTLGTSYQQAFYVDFSQDNVRRDSLEKMAMDKRSPARMGGWRSGGSTKTDAGGDLNTDGFNEREGCYELTCGGNNTVFFWFNIDSVRTRYYPVFKMNSYTGATAPTRVMIISADERVVDTCYASRGDVNISLLSGNRVIFQLNRVISGPCIIFCAHDNNLAVEMSRFFGTSDSGACRLNWVTESESENKGFRLLRRVSPRDVNVTAKKFAAGDTLFNVFTDYTKSEALKGHLTKASRTDYAFTDERVELGRTYEYALEAVDISGNTQRYPETVTLTVDQRFAFELMQNFPNPFNPTTVIRYMVPGTFSSRKAIPVRLLIYNIRGQLVKNLVQDEKTPSAYSVIWNGKANNGRLVASGVYLYRIEVNNKLVKTKKMVIVK
ncbi:MAG: DNRLRE domain-containing protein, partial [Fibrobacterota bacterium]